MTTPHNSALHDSTVRGFASDNYSGVHPDVLAAIATANNGHQVAYGEDVYTARLQELFRGMLGDDVEAFPVFNGTGANVIGLQSMLPRWGAVVAATTAHINVDEGGAPERVAGIKILSVPTDNGKLTPELIDREAWGWGDEHRAQPLAVSITQSSELGTLYTVDEIRAIADHIHPKGMHLHMDGARIANAAAALDVPLRAFTRDAGVDVLSFGGTKNGAMIGEAIVVMNPDAAEGLLFLRKLNMQLSSKMRFISAQLVALLENDLWLKNATALQRDGSALAVRRRVGPCGWVDQRRRIHAAHRGQRRVRDACPRASPTTFARHSASTTGTPRAAKCGGCARSTPSPRMSTRSSPNSPA